MTSAGPGRGRRLRLTACLAFVALPDLVYLPVWIIGLAAGLFAWQFLAAWHNHPPPGRVSRFVLAAAMFAAVFAGYGQINGPQAGISLLLLLLILKLCETRSHRDMLVFVSLCCFLLVCQFLFSQRLLMAGYLLIGAWLLIGMMSDVATHATPSQALAASARLLVQALPLAILLFVLFPRVPGPLWGLGANDSATARTGLSDTMRPGSVAELARANGVALRARFADGPPPPSARYWRGPVLWDFYNATWHAGGADRELAQSQPTSTAGHTRRTRITLQPTGRKWLIALDLPLDADRDFRRGADGSLTVAHAIQSRTRYTVRSALSYTLDARLAAATRQRALRLPRQGNPRARRLAERWRRHNDTPTAIVDAALQRFRRQPYIYTLAPQRSGRRDAIDAFLFSTREGFCEHYAGAFTFLMRAAGIPARVVTGYQGGERALVGDYWIVRYSDAHAWSEVWLAGRGWVRVDPTAAVAPGRIETGVANAVSDSAALPYMARASSGGWYRARMLWDSVNAAWDRFFLGYGPRLQQRLLDTLRIASLGQALIVLTAGIIGVLCCISLALAWRMRRPPSQDKVLRQWQQVCARLAATGYPRATHEGPRDYSRRVAAARPELATEIRRLAELYIRLRYAPEPGPRDRAVFLHRARLFRPRWPRFARATRN